MRDCFGNLLSGNAYYVYNKSIGKEKLFLCEDNYEYFLRLYLDYIEPIADTFSYSLLPDYFHFFLRIKKFDAIQKQMKALEYRNGFGEDVSPKFLLQQFSNFFNSYTKSFNWQQRRQGKLFIEPFRRRLISATGRPRLIHFIHSRPVEHGLCKKIEDWPYTSFLNLMNVGPNWLQFEEVISWFGSIEAYRQLHLQTYQMTKQPRRF